MAKTIVYGTGCNRGPNGDLQSSPSFLSREETPKEATATERYARAACRMVGVPAQAAKVYFYGDTAKVRIGSSDHLVTVHPSDL